MSSGNYIKNVAFVGAGGNSGSHMVRSILATGKHTITALTRPDSKSTLPAGVIPKHVDYSDPSTLVSALQNQDCLVITMSAFAGQDPINALIHAAAAAKVPWVLPNMWGIDHDVPGLVEDVPVFASFSRQLALIDRLGVSAWVAVVCGFWYEWSLSLPHCFGIDLLNRRATLYDDGETRISTSTWPQVGRAVAAILSLPVKPEAAGGDPERCLEKLRNRRVYINSFTVTQKEMLASAMRVTGTTEAEWEVGYQPLTERFEAASKEMKAGGDFKAMPTAMYARSLYKSARPAFEDTRGTQNAFLGLEKEDIDEATRATLERAKIYKGGYVPAE